MQKPKPPLDRFIIEGSGIPDCPNCSSTTKKKYIFFGKSVSCHNPNCDYFDGLNEKDRTRISKIDKILK